MDKVSKLYNKINNCNKPIIVFGLSYCGYSKNTKEYLQSKKINYKFYIIDKYYDIFFNLLNKISKLNPNFNINIEYKMVPIIFINKKFIGGYSDLIQIIK